MPGRQRHESLEGSWEWLNFAADLPSRPFKASQAGASSLIGSGRYVFRGITGTNASTAAGTLQVLDGQDASGVLVQYIAVAASSALSSPYLGTGVLLENGCYIVNSGITTTATVWLVPLWHYPFTPPGE